jgi:hypothetical protein
VAKFLLSKSRACSIKLSPLNKSRACSVRLCVVLNDAKFLLNDAKFLLSKSMGCSVSLSPRSVLLKFQITLATSIQSKYLNLGFVWIEMYRRSCDQIRFTILRALSRVSPRSRNSRTAAALLLQITRRLIPVHAALPILIILILRFVGSVKNSVLLCCCSVSLLCCCWSITAQIK